MNYIRFGVCSNFDPLSMVSMTSAVIMFITGIIASSTLVKFKCLSDVTNLVITVRAGD